MQFSDLKLSAPVLRALEVEGYEIATPIQAQSIPHVLSRRDVLGCAQTGTGKTAAFALPILDRLHHHPAPATGKRKVRALVLCPTRELAAQIGNGFRAYGREVKARYSVIFGGVSQGGQVDSLRSGVDVVIACPGRLLDLMNQGFVDLSGVDTLVLDEADRMLDMGFIHDIRRIVAKLPADRQTLLYSATMPPEIRKLADSILRNPVSVAVAPVSSTADRIEESVYFVTRNQKVDLLAHLVRSLPMYRSIVFTRTKHGADKVVRKLERHGIQSAAIHGNKSQNNRNRALHAFRENKIGVLVATDIAARGIDIDGVTHVVNFDLTHEPETYVHRIGRTARAGASGFAVSFCDAEERANLVAIEKLIRRKIGVAETPAGLVIVRDDGPSLSADHRPSRDGRDRPSRDDRRPTDTRRDDPRRDDSRRDDSRRGGSARADGRNANAVRAEPRHPAHTKSARPSNGESGSHGKARPRHAANGVAQSTRRDHPQTAKPRPSNAHAKPTRPQQPRANAAHAAAHHGQKAATPVRPQHPLHRSRPR